MSTNYSLYSVPAIWFIGIGTHFSAIALSKASKELPPFDNVAPREFLNSVRGVAKTSKDARKLLRIEAAQQNTFENIGLYAAAVVAGNIARLPTSYLNTFAASYVGLRLLYSVLYAQTESKVWSNLRSVAYVSSIAAIMTTFVKAGNVLNLVKY